MEISLGMVEWRVQGYAIPACALLNSRQSSQTVINAFFGKVWRLLEVNAVLSIV